MFLRDDDDNENLGFFDKLEEEDTKISYRENQAKLRDMGFNPYNSDYVDEFPSW